MKTSQNETLCWGAILFLSLSLSSLCYAAPVGVGSSDQRLQKHVGDKNGRLSKSLTSLGGSSDGGGNAVAGRFFDFYENEGSQKVTANELVRLEPLAGLVIKKLNTMTPAIGSLSSGGFGDILLKSIATKNLYLEIKEISSESCINQSMVATDSQKIVGCQSDLDVRFDVKWMSRKDVTAADRAGLILHEMFLAWARSLNSGEPKELLEQKVRELNRASFHPSIQSGAFTDLLQKYFGVRAFSAEKYIQAKQIAEKIAVFEEQYPAYRSNQQTALVFDGIKTGEISSENCRFFLDGLRSTIPLKKYEVLQKNLIGENYQICLPE